MKTLAILLVSLFVVSASIGQKKPALKLVSIKQIQVDSLLYRLVIDYDFKFNDSALVNEKFEQLINCDDGEIEECIVTALFLEKQSGKGNNYSLEPCTTDSHCTIYIDGTSGKELVFNETTFQKCSTSSIQLLRSGNYRARAKLHFRQNGTRQFVWSNYFYVTF